MTSQQFKLLVTSHHRRLYRCALHILGNVNDAEDAVQDTYLRLWNNREELEDVKNMESYCISVVRKVCFDRLRANEIDTSTEMEDLHASSIPATRDEQVIEARDEIEHLHKALNNLPEAQRIAVTMRDLEDCTMEDIESATGYTQVNIRMLLSRGRKSIREQLSKVFDYGH